MYTIYFVQRARETRVTPGVGRRDGTLCRRGCLEGDQKPRPSPPGRSARERVPDRLPTGAFEPTAVATLRAGEQSVLDVGAEQSAGAPGSRDERLHLGPAVAQGRAVFAQFDVGGRVYLGHM